jgi:histidinol-phosphate aminotransferase
MTPRDASAARVIAATIRPDVQALTRYAVADGKETIKLDAMESPYALPEAIQEAVARAVGKVALNRYPSADPRPVKQAVRTAFGIADGADLMLGNGSDELISLAIQSTCVPGDVVMSPWPSFVMYEAFARLNHATFVGVPLTAELQIDVPAMVDAMARHRPKIVFLAVPNNPTGLMWSADAIRTVVEAAPGLVVIDEAYHAFAKSTSMDLVTSHPNVVIVRTVSKIGLAGMRLGYLAGAPAWIEQLDKLRPPYNLNVLTQAAIVAVLEHKPVLDAQAAQICADRETLIASLAALPGVKPYPSAANFVLVDFSALGGMAGMGLVQSPAARIFNELKTRGILVRNVGPMHPLLAECLRISIGTPDDNAALLAALKDILPLIRN